MIFGGRREFEGGMISSLIKRLKIEQRGRALEPLTIRCVKIPSGLNLHPKMAIVSSVGMVFYAFALNAY